MRATALAVDLLSLLLRYQHSAMRCECARRDLLAFISSLAFITNAQDLQPQATADIRDCDARTLTISPHRLSQVVKLHFYRDTSLKQRPFPLRHRHHHFKHFSSFVAFSADM